MKKLLKSIFIAIMILAVAALLGAVGIQLDKDLLANRPDGAMGHGIPVYTMILPMLWLGLVVWISIIREVIKFIRVLIRKIKSGHKGGSY